MILTNNSKNNNNSPYPKIELRPNIKINKGDWVLVYNYHDNEYGFDLAKKIQKEDIDRFVFYGEFGTRCLLNDVIKIEIH